jgi:hypothetical protein
MSKRNRGEKEAARLRREVEILKAQLAEARPNWSRVERSGIEQAGTGQPLPVNQPSYSSFRTTSITDYSYLRRDLLKTGALSVLAFASIFLIYFYQEKADQILKLLSPIFHR